MGEPTAEHWRAGMARLDVTPPLRLPLSGFGGRAKATTGILDPLHATALVLENAERSVALISADVLSLDAEQAAEIRTRASEATGIPAGNILVHATHTHAGPLSCSMLGFGRRDPRYESVLIERTGDAVRLAKERMQPVELAFGVHEVQAGINRRLLRNGTVHLAPNPDGPRDDRVMTLAFLPRGEGRRVPIGLVVWTAVHPVVLGSENSLISRDFPGVTVDTIERALPGATCLYLTGPCGNIRPNFPGDTSRLEGMFAVGRRVAGAALCGFSAARRTLDPSLRVVQSHVQVPLLPLPPINEVRSLWESRRAALATTGLLESDWSAFDSQYAWAAKALAALRKDAGAPLPQTHLNVELQVLRIGEVTLAAMPFEVFVEYQAGLDRTQRDAFIVGFANGNYGYLYTQEAFSAGGYEVDRAFYLYQLQQFAPECESVVGAALAQLVSELERDAATGTAFP